ncbi:hypothetical protein DXG01_002894 [Tephrocybe rancida]|nr:hypothetical protein DXG01_002894 [Tephrocybe rancida]
MKRLVTLLSTIFSTWAPKLYVLYARNIDEFCSHNSELRRNWLGSVFTVAVFNLGPQTVCYSHKDFSNLSFGWCAITALRNFDPTRGGHLILRELGVAIEFPPGSSMLIPSACIEHVNVAIQAEETRYSSTQYTAGALFCWVEHRMEGNWEFFEKLSKAERGEVQLQDLNRWQTGLLHFSTIDELKALSL